MVIGDLAITGPPAAFERAAYLRAKVLDSFSDWYYAQTSLFGSFNHYGIADGYRMRDPENFDIAGPECNHSGVAPARLCWTNMVGKTV